MASNTSPTSRSPPENITMTAPSDSHAKATKSEESSLAYELDADAEFHGDLSQDLPSQQTVDECAEEHVFGADRKSRKFKSLYAGEGIATRQLIIFVRHFFCGHCREFLRALCASITPDALLALETPTFITIVGCGSAKLIPEYAQATGCPFPIFADPAAVLYKKLGMQRSLSLGNKKPDYLSRTSLVQSTVEGIFESIKSGRDALHGGNIKQIGGEVLFEDEQVTWIHRMKNTRDHSEIQELRRVLGLKAEPKVEDEGSRRGRSRGASAVSKRTSKSWSRKSDSTSDKEKEKEKDMMQKEYGYKEDEKEKRKSKRRSFLPDMFAKREEPPSPVDEYQKL